MGIWSFFLRDRLSDFRHKGHQKMKRTSKVKACHVHVYGSAKPALVDETDFLRVAKHTWHFDGNGIVRVNTPRGKIKTTDVLQTSLGGFVLNSAENCTHYINDDYLDARRSNLVVLTRSQNGGTQRLHRNNSSGYKGVSWHRACKKWQAYICPNGKQIRLGWFEDKIAAARAYDLAAIKYFGHNARTNFTWTAKKPIYR